MTFATSVWTYSMSLRSATVAPDLTWTVTSEWSFATGCCTFLNRLLPTSNVVGFGGESLYTSACVFVCGVLTGNRSLVSSRRHCTSWALVFRIYVIESRCLAKRDNIETSFLCSGPEASGSGSVPCTTATSMRGVHYSLSPYKLLRIVSEQ